MDKWLRIHREKSSVLIIRESLVIKIQVKIGVKIQRENQIRVFERSLINKKRRIQTGEVVLFRSKVINKRIINRMKKQWTYSIKMILTNKNSKDNLIGKVDNRIAKTLSNNH